jgi:hypothetical protein
MKRGVLALGLFAIALGHAEAQCVAGSYSPTLATYSAAGTNQGNATPVTSNINIVTSVGSNTGVVLIGSSVNNQLVENRGANVLNVYPNSGAQIEGNGTNVAVTIAVGSQVMFNCTTTTQCYAIGSRFY